MLFFRSGGGEALESWLSRLPREVDLADADESILEILGELPELSGTVGLEIGSKIAAHKRPRLIPIFGPALVDCYASLTGVVGEASWPSLLRFMQRDLALPVNRDFLKGVAEELAIELDGPVPSHLRMVDIAIWMESNDEACSSV